MSSRNSRRDFLAVGAATGLLCALPSRTLAQQKNLVVATFPGTWNEAHRNVLAPYFRKRTGASVTQSIQLATEQLAKLIAAQIRADSRKHLRRRRIRILIGVELDVPVVARLLTRRVARHRSN